MRAIGFVESHFSLVEVQHVSFKTYSDGVRGGVFICGFCRPARPAWRPQDEAAPINRISPAKRWSSRGDGPSIALENNAQPIIAVAFPGQQGQSQPQQPAAAAQPQAQGQEGVEVSILVANPNEASKAKEVLFQSRNAANGMVVYNGNETGGRAVRSRAAAGSTKCEGETDAADLLRAFNGRPAKVTELVSQGNARILVVKRADEAQAKAAQPGQPQPAAAKEAGKAQAEANDAVIFVYLRGEQAK